MSKEAKTFLSLMVIHFILDSFGGIWPIYKHLVDIPLGVAGMIATTATFSTLLTQPLFGIWADRGYLRAAVLWGTVLTFPMMFLGPLGGWIDEQPLLVAVPILFAIMFLARLGQAMYHPAGATIAGSSFDARRSTLLAIFIAAGTVGYGTSQIMFSGVFASTGGHTEWLLIPGGLGLVLAVSWCRPVETPHEQRAGFRESIKRIPFFDFRLQCLFWLLALTSAVNQGLFFLLPEFLEAREYPTWMVNGGVMVWIVFGAAFAMVPGGYLADRFGRRHVLIGAVLLSAAAYFTLIRVPITSITMFIGLAFLTGGLISIANPIGVALGQQLFPKESSLISGVLMGLAWAVGSLAPWSVGYLASLPGRDPIFALTALGFIFIIPVVCAFLLDSKVAAPE